MLALIRPNRMTSCIQAALFTTLLLCLQQCVSQSFHKNGAGGTPSAVRAVFRHEVANHLAGIHGELVRLHSSVNQSQDNVSSLSGGIASVSQQVDKLLLYALPGFIGEAVDSMMDKNGILPNQALLPQSDYGMSEIVRRAGGLSASSANPMVPQSLRSMETLELINGNLSPALVDTVTETTYFGCQDAFQKGQRVNGVYTIKRMRQTPFRVWCDFDHSGGWAVIQRRFDGSVEFCRAWDAYSKGFGSLWGEYWLGLRAIHQLSSRGVQLSLYVEHANLGSYWYNYTHFSVAGANNNYRLSIGSVSGGFYDGFADCNSRMFSTWDKDNDESSSNCAAITCGGWWFRSCHTGNLNGHYDRYLRWYITPKTTVIRINA